MKFIKGISVALLALTFSANSFAQITIEGATLPAKLTAKTDELILNGGGLREKLIFDLYVGGLYLKAKSNDAQKVMDADEAMAIRIHVISGMITSENMTEAVDEGFEKSTDGNQAKFAAQIKEFKAAFSEEIKVGDIFDIMYIPSEGSVVYKNNKKVKTIAGLDFKKAMFGIWFCNDPADEDLKEGMLGL